MSLRVWRGIDAVKQLEANGGPVDDESTSWLPSPPVLDGELTVAQQAVRVASAHGLSEPPELADFVVDLLDADDLLDKKTWHFSRGERQMAALILVFSRPFDRLVLVDPTAGLDRRRAQDLADFLTELGAEFAVEVISDSDLFDAN